MTPRTEPAAARTRPTAMTLAHTRLAPVALAVLLLSACGSAGQRSGGAEDGTSGGSASSTSAGTVAGSCGADDPAFDRALDQARTLTKADLEGDGTAEPVRLTAPGGACGNILLATGKGTYAVHLPAGEPLVRSAYAVQVPGRAGQLVVTRSEHPRGGFQLRVYAPSGRAMAELKRGTEPLVPFVATDVQEQPLSIDCREGGFVVTQAVAHEPSGVIFAWDVRRTTYALADDATLTAGPEKEIKDNVLPAQLTKEWPDLVGHTAFASCRVG
jgi:hypothetical protein